MSFGLLKQFKDQKKSLHTQNEAKFVAHVVLGSDLGSVLKLIELHKAHPSESIRLITPRIVNKKLLIENYQYGVSQMRSQEAVSEIYKHFYDAKVLWL